MVEKERPAFTRLAIDAKKSNMSFLPNRAWWEEPVATNADVRAMRYPSKDELKLCFAPEDAFRQAAPFVVRACADITVAHYSAVSGKWSVLVLQRTDEWKREDGKAIAPIPGHLWVPGGKVPASPSIFVKEWVAGMAHLLNDLSIAADKVHSVYHLGQGRTWFPDDDVFVFTNTETGEVWEETVLSASTMDTTNYTFLAVLNGGEVPPEVTLGRGASAAFWMEEEWFDNHQRLFNPYARQLFRSAFMGLRNVSL